MATRFVRFSLFKKKFEHVYFVAQNTKCTNKSVAMIQKHSVKLFLWTVNANFDYSTLYCEAFKLVLWLLWQFRVECDDMPNLCNIFQSGLIILSPVPSSHRIPVNISSNNYTKHLNDERCVQYNELLTLHIRSGSELKQLENIYIYSIYM